MCSYHLNYHTTIGDHLRCACPACAMFVSVRLTSFDQNLLHSYEPYIPQAMHLLPSISSALFLHCSA